MYKRIYNRMDYKYYRIEKMDKNTIREIINNYLDKLKSNNVKFEKVYIFGSYAKNTATENSDIDIAFVFNKIDEKFKLQLKLMRLRRGIDLRIEPHPIDIKNFNYNNSFANEILMHGIEIN